MHRILPHITVLLISSVGSNITVLSTGDVTLLTPCVVGQTETIEGYVTDMGEYPGPLSAVPTTISFSCNVSCPTLTSVSVWCVHHCNVSRPTLTSGSVLCVHHHLLLLNLSLERTNWYLLRTIKVDLTFSVQCMLQTSLTKRILLLCRDYILAWLNQCAPWQACPKPA